MCIYVYIYIYIYIYYNNLLHLYSNFLGALHSKGAVSPHPPPMCSFHLDDATAAILRQNAHHTPAYWWRWDRVMKPISVWGWLRGHDGQGPLANLTRMPGLHPYSFSNDIMGFFMTTESQDLGLTSHPTDGAFSEQSPHHYTGRLGPTQATGLASPACLINCSVSKLFLEFYHNTNNAPPPPPAKTTAFFNQSLQAMCLLISKSKPILKHFHSEWQQAPVSTVFW